MRSARASSQLPWPLRAILSLLLLLAASGTAIPACNRTITSGNWSGPIGVAMTYPITVSGGNPQSYSASNLPQCLTVNTSTGVISGIPTAVGTYNVTLFATYNSGGCTTINLPVTFTVQPPVFAGFRLPDFLTPSGAGYTPRLMLQMGATDPLGAHPFNATLEVDASGGLGTAWVPYNHFVGVTNPSYAVTDGWITNAPLPVRDSSGPSGAPQAFSTAQLTLSQPPGPAVYMKADPRSTRFGIFQMDSNPT